MRNNFVYITCIIFILPTLAYAGPYTVKINNACTQKGGSHVDMTNCAFEGAKQLEAQMNQIFEKVKLRNRETDNEMRKAGSSTTHLEEALVQSQKDFEQYMHSECAHQVAYVQGGTAGGDIQLSCEMNMMEERIKILNTSGSY